MSYNVSSNILEEDSFLSELDIAVLRTIRGIEKGNESISWK